MTGNAFEDPGDNWKQGSPALHKYAHAHTHTFVAGGVDKKHRRISSFIEDQGSEKIV